MKNFSRILILVVFVLLIKSEAFSQSMELVLPTDGIDNIYGPPDEDKLESFPELKNLKDSQLNFKMTLTPTLLTKGHTFTFCDLNLCYPEDSVEFTSPLVSILQVGETTTSYIYIYLYPNNIEGVSEFNVKFFDVDNPSDFVDYNIIFNATTTDVNELIVKSYIMPIAWPNPAIDVVNIRHNPLLNNCSINIINTSGVLIDNIRINNAENYTSVNTSAYTSGTYLYNVIDNGKIEQSGNFIISK